MSESLRLKDAIRDRERRQEERAASDLATLDLLISHHSPDLQAIARGIKSIDLTALYRSVLLELAALNADRTDMKPDAYYRRYAALVELARKVAVSHTETNKDPMTDLDCTVPDLTGAGVLWLDPITGEAIDPMTAPTEGQAGGNTEKGA